jgi:uncharacterized membrane protein
VIDFHDAIKALVTAIAAPILLMAQNFKNAKRGFSTAMA